MDSPSSVDYRRHRLPTKSAAAALATQLDVKQVAFSTGSVALDKALGGSGFEKGRLLEICGPPGSGKTAVALQLVVDAVSRGERVCWIDTLSQCPTSRLVSLLAEQGLQAKLSQIVRYQVTSLASFFALMIHSMNIHAGTSLMIIDDISSLFTKEFPPGATDNTFSTSASAAKVPVAVRDRVEKPADKRGRLVADIANGLQRFSASRMVSIVVLNQLTTRGAAGGGPLELGPSVNSVNLNNAWANAFHHRILLLRKHIPKTDPLTIKRHLRFVFVLKSAGIDIQNTNLSRSDQVFVIKITENGVEDDKQQVFNAATGAISMAEAFTNSGQDSEESYFDDFSDDTELGENTSATPPGEGGGGHLKRKRSDDSNRSLKSRTDKDAENKRTVSGEITTPVRATSLEGESETSDESSNPLEIVLESGAGVFPVLSQALGARPAESQEKAEATVVTGSPASGIPQKHGRTFVPDSDGESDDDILAL